jgi:hypothetical protein
VSKSIKIASRDYKTIQGRGSNVGTCPHYLAISEYLSMTILIIYNYLSFSVGYNVVELVEGAMIVKVYFASSKNTFHFANHKIASSG